MPETVEELVEEAIRTIGDLSLEDATFIRQQADSSSESIERFAHTAHWLIRQLEKRNASELVGKFRRLFPVARTNKYRPGPDPVPPVRRFDSSVNQNTLRTVRSIDELPYIT